MGNALGGEMCCQQPGGEAPTGLNEVDSVLTQARREEHRRGAINHPLPPLPPLVAAVERKQCLQQPSPDAAAVRRVQWFMPCLSPARPTRR